MFLKFTQHLALLLTRDLDVLRQCRWRQPASLRTPLNPSLTSHTTSGAAVEHVWPRPPTFGGSIYVCYIRKVFKCVVLRPIPIVRTSNLGPQNRHFAAPRSSVYIYICMCVCVCVWVRSTFISLARDRRKLMIWKRERDDPPNPRRYTQKRRSVEHIKALGKALQCFSCFQIFVHSSSFFFPVPFSFRNSIVSQ